MRYCYICNKPMTRTIFVCDDHERNEPHLYALSVQFWRLGERHSPDDPIPSELMAAVNPDLTMDIGL